jgi:hypothetical protein
MLLYPMARSLCFLPLHHNIARNKWVYKIKRKQDGTIEGFKAQLVHGKGFDQKSSVISFKRSAQLLNHPQSVWF